MGSADYDRIEQAILYLGERFRRQPRLEDVARKVGLSEYHFHRLFTRWAGITPKRFLQVLTAEHARGLLRESRSVLDAAWEAGLSGPGRLHDLTVNVYAMTPGEVRGEAAGITIRYGVHPSPFGRCLLAVTERGVCGLSFVPAGRTADAVEDLGNRWSRATVVEDAGATRAIAERIFEPRRWRNAAPLNVLVRGTNFQVRVWEALVRIPPGCVLSYEDLAVRAGAPRAARAVGSALARNPVAFLIPCHRVIRKTGEFGEYGGGAPRKGAMLAWEAARFRDPAGRPEEKTGGAPATGPARIRP